MLFYMKVHDSAICETWQLPLWAEQMAVIKTQCREQVDKDISIITLLLYSYAWLQDTIKMRGFVTLEQEEFAYLWKIILAQQLILYVLLINIIHLLSKGAGRGNQEDIQNL